MRPDHGNAAFAAVQEQLLGAGQAGPPVKRDPPWVNPNPDVNPVYLEPVPDHLVEALEATPRGDKTNERFRALYTLVRHITSEVHSAIIEGGKGGVSASHLYWAWQEAEYGQFGHQGDTMAELSACGLIAYDPTATTDQQVVAIGDVCEIEWVDDAADGEVSADERGYPGAA